MHAHTHAHTHKDIQTHTHKELTWLNFQSLSTNMSMNTSQYTILYLPNIDDDVVIIIVLVLMSKLVFGRATWQQKYT